MATITEDFVSFEIAKLLKEKGFDETCYACYEYFSSSITMYSGWPFEYKGEPVRNSKDIITCPTLQMAMKWLREVHNIFIDISPTYNMKEKTIHFIWQIFDSNYDFIGDCEIFYNNYEQACEEAIKYCLENLI